VFLLLPAHPGSPGQRAVKRSLLLLLPAAQRCLSGSLGKGWTVDWSDAIIDS